MVEFLTFNSNLLVDDLFQLYTLSQVNEVRMFFNVYQQNI